MQNQLPPDETNALSTNGSGEFTPPRHWVTPEELSSDYWSDPKVQEKRSQEFQDKPVETIEMIDRMDKAGIARRDFLTIMGASMAMASFSCARRPVHKIIPYVVKPEEVTPGVANWYASTHPDTHEGILIKVREGRPIKVEGNPEHPLNLGALSSRAQGSVLDLYDPDRLKEPLRRNRASGGVTSATWAQADQAIVDALKAGTGKVRLMTGALHAGSTTRLVQEFAGAFRATSVEFEPLNLEEIADAQDESYGAPIVPHYRFEEAELVLSLGADFLGNWLGSTEHASAWGRVRKLRASEGQDRFAKLVVFEPGFSLTGANADERYGIRPGDEVSIALAVAYDLIVNRKLTRYAGDGSVSSALQSYRPESVASEIGLADGVEIIKKLAQTLWSARGKSLVIGGSLASKTRDALSLQIAINFLNSALENEGVTVDGVERTRARQSSRFADVEALIREMKAGQVSVLIIQGANPVYTLPTSLGFVEALKKVPLVVNVSTYDHETSLLADWSLPNHHYLENWGDVRAAKGVVSLQQPALAPIHSSRAFQDSLIQWMRLAAIKPAGVAGRVLQEKGDGATWYDYLRANWKEMLHSELAAGTPFEVWWEGALREGVLKWGPVSKTSAPRAFRVGSLAKVQPLRPMSPAIYLSLYAKTSIYDGRVANNAWLQELPDPISTVVWDNYLNVGTALAKKLDLKSNEVVEVSLGEEKVLLPVMVQPGIHPSVVTVAVGYGRAAAGKVGTGTGWNVFPFVRVESGRLTYAGQAVQIRKVGRTYQLAATQTHNLTENRPIVNDITLDEYRKNPATENHTDPHLRMKVVPTMWTKHEYKGYRWGMAVDLTSCIGCGACSIACQAENNIPVVGRDNVRVSREMHWIRIDRYYSGSAENPDVVFQPMLCQHCENAPCETVCPVIATVHNDEGLNEQVYNRCVGTRYCQNNCPYKVRRFNFFDHWKNYEGTMNMVWNPDVTVRTRGIMEKCTFCVQRINEAKSTAKDLGRKVMDGDFKTACQQTCPTDAIVFGDVNNPESRVAKVRNDGRAFRALEILNVGPMVSYLSKVRNKPSAAHGHAGQSPEAHH